MFLWQLPQNIIGFLLTRTYEFKSDTATKVPVYFKKNFFYSGVSLGNYIILDYYYIGRLSTATDIKHEYGHCRQSKRLGWLYLLVIGLPSLCGNLIDRFFHKSWTSTERVKWYYNQPWEKWADRLGGVERF